MPVERIVERSYAYQYNGSNLADMQAAIPPSLMGNGGWSFVSEVEGVLTLRNTDPVWGVNDVELHAGDWVTWNMASGSFGWMPDTDLEARYLKASDI